MNDKINIAIVDDHALVLEGVVELLDKENFNTIHKLNSGEELVKTLSNNAVSLVLLDIDMPGMGGINTAKWIQENRPKIKVIALSALNDEISVIRMFKAGAKAYLHKTASKEEFHIAISEVLKNDAYLANKEARDYFSYTSNIKVKEATKIILELSENELTFIQLMCDDLKNKEIADRMNVSPRTSEGWTKNLFKKLGVNSRIGIVQFAYKNNLVKY